MARVLETNNVYFDPLQIVHDVIFKNVPDPNKLRASKSKENERRWIFPTTPEENDENYPRIAILHGRPRVEEAWAGQLLEEQKDFDERFFREVFSNMIILPVTIGVFTKKTKHKKLEVKDYDGTLRNVQNSAQVAYLLDKIQKELHRNRRDFIDKDIDFKVLDFEGAYRDNDFLWAGNINMELTLKNVWTQDYTEGELIETITLAPTTTPTGG